MTDFGNRWRSCPLKQINVTGIGKVAPLQVMMAAKACQEAEV